MYFLPNKLSGDITPLEQFIFRGKPNFDQSLLVGENKIKDSILRLDRNSRLTHIEYIGVLEKLQADRWIEC